MFSRQKTQYNVLSDLQIVYIENSEYMGRALVEEKTVEPEVCPPLAASEMPQHVVAVSVPRQVPAHLILSPPASEA